MSARNTLTAARHVVVEGPIGAGKTTLARRLGAHVDAQLLLEQPELNPFLSRFYQDQQRFALQTQLFFRFQRLDKMRDLVQPDFFNHPVVADYLLEKDPLFARVRKCGIDMERRIGDAYLNVLADHLHFFYNYEAAPVMVVNSENLNFVDTGGDFQLLVKRIEAMRGHREYFNRGE